MMGRKRAVERASAERLSGIRQDQNALARAHREIGSRELEDIKRKVFEEMPIAYVKRVRLWAWIPPCCGARRRSSSEDMELSLPFLARALGGDAREDGDWDIAVYFGRARPC